MNLNCQTDSLIREYFKNNSFKIKSKNEVFISKSLASHLLTYKLLLFGEIHGSSETSKYLYAIIKEISKKSKVLLAIELPDELNRYIKNRNLKLNSDSFFIKKTDARANCDWINLINSSNNLKNVEVFCFEPNYSIINSDNYDSLMYASLNNKINLDTNRIVVVLSGNFHVKVQESKYGKSMGFYFLNSPNSMIQREKILFINTLCEKGSYYRIRQDELILSDAPNSAGIFSNYSIYKQYFISFPDLNNGFNGFIYTETLSPSSYNCR